MQPEQVQESEPVAVSCQTELESCDVVSKDKYDKLKEEMENIEKEHHEMLLRCAEKEVEKMPANHPETTSGTMMIKFASLHVQLLLCEHNEVTKR